MRSRRVEELYRLLQEHIKDVVWVVDLELRYTYVTPSIEDLRGYTVEETMAESIRETLTPESYAKVTGLLQEEILRGAHRDRSRSWLLVIEMTCKDGATVWGESKVSFLYDDHGEPIGIIGVTRDISDRKRAEDELHRWAHVFEKVHWGIALSCGGWKHLESSNPAFARMHGYAPEEVAGLSPYKIVAPEYRDRLRDHFRAVDENGYDSFDSVQLRKDGTSFPARIESTSVSADDGRHAFRAIHIQDISEQLRGEKALRMASRLEATSTLAGGIAHDFNNLMVAVMGNAALLRLHVRDHPECVEMLGEIEHAAERAGMLAQQMLAYARGGKYQPKVINMNHVVKDATDLQRRSLPQRVELNLDLETDLWNITADPSQMSQVIMNLCINAGEAVGERGRIRVVARNDEVSAEFAHRHPGMKPGRFVHVWVEDTGHGMGSGIRARVFEPFFTTKSTGRGLGLAAVYGIIKNHNGYIYVDSQEGAGTTFHFYLPATAVATSERAMEQIGLPTGTETILVVDDEVTVSSVTKKLLERFGYNVIVAANGKDAVSVAKSFAGEIHLALLDMGMPVMGGAEAFPLLRKARPKMKVIVCSGYDLDSSSQALLDQGASAFLQKPFLPTTLGVEIRQALDR